jgi:hypothetical protein
VAISLGHSLCFFNALQKNSFEKICEKICAKFSTLKKAVQRNKMAFSDAHHHNGFDIGDYSQQSDINQEVPIGLKLI